MQSLKDRHQLDEIAMGEGEILRERAYSRGIAEEDGDDQFNIDPNNLGRRETNE